jgi:hypothetical protein
VEQEMSTRTATGEPQGQGADFDPLAHFSRIFCRFLQVVFAGFDKGDYHWDKDEKLSDITISDQATIGKEVVMRRPAILVARGPAAFTNTSLNQLAGPLVGYKSVGKIDGFVPNVAQDGATRHTDLIAATMQYNCLSREGLEAQRLAWATGYFTRALKTALLKAGLHRVGEEVSFGAESAPGTIVTPDTNEIIMVTTSVPFYFQDTYTVGPKYKVLLNEVVLALTSEVEGTLPGSPTLLPPSIYGRTFNKDNSTLVQMDSKLIVTEGPRTPFRKRPKQ